MANPLPTLRGSSQQALFPFTRTVSFLTRVNKFQNGTEQRWPSRAPLYSFELRMSALLAADQSGWLSFFNTQKGRLNQDLTLTLGSTTYSHLALQSDGLQQQTSSPKLYDQVVSLRQTQNASWTPPSMPASSYPTLSAGVVCEYPFTESSEFFSSVQDSEIGQRYVYAWYAAGLTGFPSNYQRTWKLEYPVLSDADLATLETFFMTQQGRYSSFSFTDPVDTLTYTHVRFDSDQFQIRYQDYNRSSVTVLLRQTNNS